ncbi:fibronectin type III domain-containing protein [Streptomyces sp. NPDC050504]|uniref:fibronectin type III domain-containing protein n=1 Tax=Streptomyces sp. NPDC050504 TaxID=3365618 RepID=UPI0037BA6DE6
MLTSLLLLTACSAAEGDDKGGKDTRAPTVPAGVTAQATSATSVHVMWNAAADDRGVTGYELRRAGAPVKLVPAGRTMVDVEGLAPSTAYSFTVRARDAAGNFSAPSPAVPVTTQAPAPADRRAPTVPGAVTGRVEGTDAVTLTWRRSSDDIAVTSYDIYQEDIRIHSVGSTLTSTRVGGLRPGTVYTFTVRARDASDKSSGDSNAVDLTTRRGSGTPASTAPTGLRAVPGAEGIDLSWDPPKTTGGAPVSSYELYLNGKPATTVLFGGEPPEGRAAYRISTDLVAPGTRYSIKLRARLPDGKWGDFSAQRTVTVAS